MAKIALVTGGSRGLGKDMALSLAAKGIDVIVTYHSRKDDADAVVAAIRGVGRKAEAMQLDVADITGLDGFMQRLKAVLKNAWNTGRLDFLINNAGTGAAIPIAQHTETTFDNFLNVHFKGVFFLTQKTLEMMNDQGGIVFITAAGSRFVVPNYSVYAACKGAVEVFSRYVAFEYGKRGIRANVVAPGGIETDFNGGVIRNTPQLQQFLITQTALGRVGLPEDIGGVVAFLCTDDARWVNGQRIEVTGGIHL